jgi:hypothetical protein
LNWQDQLPVEKCRTWIHVLAQLRSDHAEELVKCKCVGTRELADALDFIHMLDGCRFL